MRRHELSETQPIFHFRAWTKASVWENVLSTMIQQDIIDEATLMLDSTSIKVHQHVSGVKKGENESTGHSRGGLTTKVHMITDGLGNPLRFLLSTATQVTFVWHNIYWSH